MSVRRLASEYVSKHLHGLSVHSVMPAATETPSKVIATHSGSFHCDEAMACGFLRHTPAFSAAAVVRTRDSALIDQCTIVVDVGTVYDAEKLRFDHHQSSFHGTMTTAKNTYKTRLSSAGLVYKHFGRDIIQDFVRYALSSPARSQLLAMTSWSQDTTALTAEDLEVLYDKLYKAFVEEVDGVDNGVEAFGVAADVEATKLVKNYQQSSSLSSRVGKLQSWWNDELSGEAATTQENAAFAEAVEITSLEFFEAVSFYAFSWMPARSLVERAFLDAANTHPSGQIVCLRERFCPWKDHLLDLEKEHGCHGRTLYVVYSDGKGWRVQAVPKEATGFENRKALPYRGLRDQELSTASGIDGGIFIHVSGFIGGMKTFDGAMALAVKALTVE